MSQQALTFNHNVTPLFSFFPLILIIWWMHLNKKSKKDKFISLKIVEFLPKTGFYSNLGKQTHLAIGSIGYIYFDWIHPVSHMLLNYEKL